MSAADLHAVQLRQERMDGEVKLLASTVTQHTQLTQQAMQAMSADMKQMAADVRGMAPHAADIGRLYRSIEAQNSAMLSMGERQSRLERQQNRWAGGLVAIMTLGGVLFGTLTNGISKEIGAVADKVAEGQKIYNSELARFERRLERLERPGGLQ